MQAIIYIPFLKLPIGSIEPSSSTTYLFVTKNTPPTAVYDR